MRGGTGPEYYSTYEMQKGGTNDGKVTERRIGRPPEHVDLIYSYRPLSELPGIIATAKELGAKTIWSQSGVTTCGVSDAKGCWVPEEELQRARNLVESEGLNLVSEPYIGTWREIYE
jgi:predicted CoA-binding protein